MGMSNVIFRYITNLQYKVKSLSSRVQSFESEQKYELMHAEFERHIATKDQEIKKLRSEVASAHMETVTVRNNWMEVFDDLQKEHAKEMQRKDCIIKVFEKRTLRAEKRVDELKDESLALRQECYAIKTELEEECAKNQKLVA